MVWSLHWGQSFSLSCSDSECTSLDASDSFDPPGSEPLPPQVGSSVWLRLCQPIRQRLNEQSCSKSPTMCWPFCFCFPNSYEMSKIWHLLFLFLIIRYTGELFSTRPKLFSFSVVDVGCVIVMTTTTTTTITTLTRIVATVCQCRRFKHK